MLPKFTKDWGVRVNCLLISNLVLFLSQFFYTNLAFSNAFFSFAVVMKILFFS